MREKEKTSICILTADPCSPQTQECLRRVKEFTREDYELLLLRNTRKDFSFSHDNNRLLKVCEGNAIVFLNDDCFVAPGWLSKMLQSPADIVGGLSGEGHGRYACFALCLVRTYVFEKIGFLDERFQLGYEDTEFSSRALKAGFKIDVVDTGSVHLGRRSSFGLQPLARKTKSAFLFWHGIERKPFSEMLLLLAFEPLMLFLISVLGKDFAYSKFLPLAKRFVRSPWEA